MTLEVVDAGPLTTIQTPPGRPGWRHLGVPVGGAADRPSAALANRLVGALADAPLLEATLAGPMLRFEVATLVAVTGASWEATLDGMPLPPNQARHARAGSVLRVGTGAGARAYIAVAGLQFAPVLGSAATDVRTGFGGHEGRELRAGDRLHVAKTAATPMRWLGTPASGPIRVVAGPHAGWFALHALTSTEWHVSGAADRTGVRLEPDAELRHEGGAGEIPSIGVPEGAIQVPPGGAPIVMLADGPVTGGYPVPACVIAADVGRVAQLRPGDVARLALLTLEEAATALRQARAALERLEPFSITGDDELGWAGSID